MVEAEEGLAIGMAESVEREMEEMRERGFHPDQDTVVDEMRNKRRMIGGG